MRIRGLLLDVEGVLVRDKRYQAVDGAVEFIARMRERHMPLCLISNNTTDARPAIIEKLTRAGYDFQTDELLTCIGAALDHLRQTGARRCLILGTPDLGNAFAAAGFDPVEGADADAVVVGLDPELDHERLTLACHAILRSKARLIALHRNRLYTDAEGRDAPSVGAIAECLVYATQAEPEVMGKPSPAIFRQGLRVVGVPAEEALMVSDDPFSDLAGARRLGMKAAFVLSGKYPDRSIVERIAPAERPDIIVDGIGDLSDSDLLAV